MLKIPQLTTEPEFKPTSVKTSTSRSSVTSSSLWEAERGALLIEKKVGAAQSPTNCTSHHRNSVEEIPFFFSIKMNLSFAFIVSQIAFKKNFHQD